MPVERVAVDQDNRLPGTVALTVDLDVVRILLTGGVLATAWPFSWLGGPNSGQARPVVPPPPERPGGLPMRIPSGWDEVVRVRGIPSRHPGVRARARGGPGRGAGSTMAGDPPKGRRVMLWGRRQQCEALDGLTKLGISSRNQLHGVLASRRDTSRRDTSRRDTSRRDTSRRNK